MKKKLFAALSFLMLLAFLFSCHKQPNIDGFKIEIEKLEVGASAVTIEGSYTYPGTATIQSIAAIIGQRSDFEDANEFDVNLEGYDFGFTVTGLDPSTLYYYRFVVDYGGETDYYTESDTFTTKDFSLPAVRTLETSYVGPHEAICGGIVTDDGGYAVTARGICYGTEPNPTLDGLYTIDSCGMGPFESELTGLRIGTNYYYRAYATTEMGTAYGVEMQFTTSAQSPTVVTLEVVSDGEMAAIVKAEVVSDGGNSVTERGVCWSTNGAPTLDDTFLTNGFGIGNFSCRLADLQPNTTYWVSAFARNDVGVGFGEVLSFTTGMPIVPPTVNTVEIRDITATSAKCTANVSANGGAEITGRGVCWSKNAMPSLSDHHAAAGTGLGSYIVDLTGLSPNTTYYARAYATNHQGTAYGEVVSFTTTDGLPVVNTASVTNITGNSATSGGEVIDQGASAVTERGICWSTSQNPTTSADHANSGSGLGTFTVEMTGLTNGQTYYVRAYAINNQGVNYGDEVSFVATEGLAEVITAAVVNITSNSATGGGNVLSQGASSVIERGICWGTEHHPTLSGNHLNNGFGEGSFTVEMTHLASGTTYYVRAYAINNQGVVYGGEMSFTTVAVKPEVITLPVNNVTQTTAIGGGNVTSNGGATVTERGICWSMNHNPTLDDNSVSGGAGIGSFMAQMTGLATGTTYYVRAYAINNQGVSYGGEVSFTTMANSPTVTTAQASNVTQTTALGGGNVIDDGGAMVTERGICWSLSHNPTVNGNHLSSGTGTGAFTVEMTGLSSNTTYYVRAYAINSAGISYGSEVGFTTTHNISSPSVMTSQTTNITQTTALGGGVVTADGGAEVIERGVCWSTNHAPSVNGSHAISGSGVGSFTVQITGLTPNTTYYVRAYAINSAGTSYGNELQFITAPEMPSVTTSPVTNIMQTSALGGGNVTDDGGAIVTERGLCWGVSHNPTVNDSHSSNGTGTGTFTVNMNDLTANTTYYVRAYATNSVGTVYGNEVSFTTTHEIFAPTVTTASVTNITQTSALGGGNVTSDGGATVTERGICWSLEHNPTINDSHNNHGTGTGVFDVEMVDLQPNSTYFVRAYAINSVGASYGEEVSFTTSQFLIAPTVTTASVTNITQTSALGGGNVTEDGGVTVTERGICWSLNHTPTVNGNHASNGTGTGSFTVNITGLTANTTYYVRAYATNSQGTSYGEEVSFTTAQNYTTPIVTTSQVTNITQTSAIGGGNVTADGGAIVTERGICWSLSQSPTVSDYHASNGAGTGSYTVNMTSLTANTTYYVRAYAINSVGISYGDEASFTTSASLPTVITSAITNIMQTSALGGGNVIVDGGATVTERGICWSMLHSPTVSDYHASNGTGTGSYAINMTNLTANTTYYVRAYAINSVGISYGEELSFTTLASLPTVTTSAITNITQTSALGGGNVSADGGTTVIERGICWSLSHNPNVSDYHASNGTGTGSYTINMTGLTANTTYFVRAYAINNVGISYGEEVSFSTLASLPTVITSAITNITQTSALGGGNVIADGGATVTDCGLCWSLTSNPTMSNNYVSSGSGTGSFTATITGLTANTTYFIRAYATNSIGTSYGEELSFTTLEEIYPPTVTTVSLTDITQTSAIGGGNVTADGGASVTERGLCWSTVHNPTTSNSHVASGSGTGSFTVSLIGLNEGITYYVRAYATNVAGTGYGEEMSFTTLPSNVPVGAVNGVFSVSGSQQVYFSKGNLQYRASTDTWRFAEKQYDFVGQGNISISATYNGWIDLFGWGTSGYNHGAVSYQPWSTSEVDGHYYAYGNASANLNDQSRQADWGYNAISNGGNQTNQWRTLTKDEWVYVFETRSTTSGIRYAKATVNDVKGVILLPDDWNASIYPLTNVNTYTAPYESNVVSASNWNTMEAAGAVFLPSAGGRVGINVSGMSHQGSSTAYGRYWSATHYDNSGIYFLSISNGTLSPSFIQNRYIGQSVRVVRSAER